MEKSRPLLFYISLELEDHIVHNYLIELGTTITIMPKKVFDIIGLVYTRCSIGVIQLEETNVKTLGVVKDVPMKLQKCPEVSVVQDIIVVDLPPMFSLCTSQEFTSKLRTYLAMDYFHMKIPFQKK